MRLLNAHTLKIHTFFGDIPPYAILSHVWGDEEVLYQDFQSGKAASLKGYTKILGCCKQVITDSLEYVWIDTCCIDKSSSSELQEAINSMFNFYRDAAVCYAYLEDVFDNIDSQASNAGNRGLSLDSDFGRSRWFTRGWTLQELLAPSLLEFYAADWTPLGTRDDLRRTVAIITRIDQDFFLYGKFSDYSIAQKFSWASGRQTTRAEDEAYCLLGLFGVSIPLLYGEGKKAFRRLQEELMRISDDQSIFAWSSTDKSLRGNSRPQRGLLASSPAAFAWSGDIVRGTSDYSSPPYSITNKGISIHLPLINPNSGYAIPYGGSTGGLSRVSIALTPTGSLAVLNCQSRKSVLTQLAIVIEQTDNNTRYSRTNSSLGLLSIPLGDIKANARQENILIQAHNIDGEGIGWDNNRQGQLIILTNLPAHGGVTLKDHSPGMVCHGLTNGVISFRIPASCLKSYQENGGKVAPLYLNLEHEGRAFSVIITPTFESSEKMFAANIKVDWDKFMLKTGVERTNMELLTGSRLKSSDSKAIKADWNKFMLNSGVERRNGELSTGTEVESSISKTRGANVTVPLSIKQLHHACNIIMPEWNVLVEHVKTELQRTRLTSSELR